MDQVVLFVCEYLLIQDILSLSVVSKTLHNCLQYFGYVTVTGSFPLSVNRIKRKFPNLCRLTISSSSHHPRLSLRLVDIVDIVTDSKLRYLELCSIDLIHSSSPETLLHNEEVKQNYLTEAKLSNVLCSSYILYALVRVMRFLRSLQLTSCPALCDMALSNIAKSLPCLRSFRVDTAFELQNADLCSGIANSVMVRDLTVTRCPRLRHLHSGGWLITCDLSNTGITAECLEDVITTNRNLQYLSVECCLYLTEVCINSDSLVRVNTRMCTSLTTMRILSRSLQEVLVRGCLGLSCLDLYVDRLTALDVSMLSALSQLYVTSRALSSLNIVGCPVLMDAMQSLWHSHCEENSIDSLPLLVCCECQIVSSRLSHIGVISNSDAPLRRCFSHFNISLCCPSLLVFNVKCPMKPDIISKYEMSPIFSPL